MDDHNSESNKNRDGRFACRPRASTSATSGLHSKSHTYSVSEVLLRIHGPDAYRLKGTEAADCEGITRFRQRVTNPDRNESSSIRLPCIKRGHRQNCAEPSTQPGLEHTMLRSVLAVIIAVITWFLVATIGNWILRLAIPGYSAVEVSMNFTLPMMICRLALGLVSSLCAGFVCATPQQQ